MVLFSVDDFVETSLNIDFPTAQVSTAKISPWGRETNTPGKEHGLECKGIVEQGNYILFPS
jgi:hypothetical protein